MPDLAAALTAIFSGGDMTIFQATVDSVGQGVVTIHVNGGTFTDVPYLDTSPMGHVWPSIGDSCYVIGRKNWGMLVIGRPAPGPDRGLTDPLVNIWTPYTQGLYSVATNTWTTPGDGQLITQPGDTSAKIAAFFLRASDMPALPATALSAAAFFLDIAAWDDGGMLFDYSYVTVGLHNTAAPNAPLLMLPNLNASYRVSRGENTYVTIPIDWGNRLIAGTAKGIYVQGTDYPTTVLGPGSVRLTNL